MCKIHLIFLLLLFNSIIAQAQFVCSSDVKYRWNKDKKEITVFWAMLEKHAATEDDAKRGLAEAANRERSRALEHCQREHQNTSGCIASRLDAAQATMSRLGFSARNKLEEAIVTDCTIKQGECAAVDVSDPVCKNLAPVTEEVKEEKKPAKK